MEKSGSIVAQINEAIALHMTLIVGTMWCFYAFVILSLLPVLFPAYQNQILYIANAFQLALLPLIMVGQSIIGKSTDKRAIEDHNMIMNEMAEIKEMHADLNAALAALKD